MALHDSIGHSVARAARVVERRLEDDLRPFGLTRIGWCIMLAVHEGEKCHPSDIATYVGIDRTATSRTLRQLETSGLIRRTMGQKDRRTTEVSLTERGMAQLKATLPGCRAAIEHFNSKLTREQLDLLRDMLDTLQDDEWD